MLTFQGTGEDAHCTEGSLPLSWLLEAVHTRSLGRQRLGPARLLRWCGLGVTGRSASAWGWMGVHLDLGQLPQTQAGEVPGGHHRGLDVTPGTGLLCSQLPPTMTYTHTHTHRENAIFKLIYSPIVFAEKT